MGVRFADQYSLLHAAVGVILNFWSVPFWLALGLHILFEFIENTSFGMSIINRIFVGKGAFRWPGGKEFPDTPLNQLGDNVFFALGWIVAYWVNRTGNEHQWHRIS
jgi:hypothetical protein